MDVHGQLTMAKVLGIYLTRAREKSECHECGETVMCEVAVSDPEPETGYVDEYALREACKNLADSKYRVS